ncbi:MAG: TonB-dependent receptor, partial [Desulfomonile sp.]|nr:TonB-dependent receptor [Desulfomonile sp.]
MLGLAVALSALSSVEAVAQETEAARPLERVDVEAPERRPAARATPEVGRGDEESRLPTTESSRDDRRPSAPTATGTVGPASSLSVVTDKPQVSLSAESLPAQVQAITPQDIRGINFWGTNSDLFTQIAGIKSLTWGQGLIGMAISMRGFNTYDGVALFVDGVPQNFPSHTGATGKSEISWLAPEVIERIEIIKGPFSALYGDFALAGVVNIVTKKSERSPSLTSSGGSFGTFRAFGVFSRETWVPTAYLPYDYYHIDGYRDNSQIKWISPFNKISVPILGGILSLRYNYFNADWGAPGYWPIDWVKSGEVDRKRAFNSSDGGYMSRSELVLNYAPASGERGFHATLYYEDYHPIRFGTFLPYGSSQFARQDDRRHWGGRVFYNLVFGDIGALIVGGETRQDSGEAQQYNTVGRQRTTTTYGYNLRLSNWALFLQGQIKPAEYLKIVGGVRWDYFRQYFDNLGRPQNSGTGCPSIQSPKIGFVITPTENFNIFGNIGQGFRSPSNLEMSPFRANSRSDFSLEPAMVRTYDIGFNAALFGNLFLAADYYHTYMQREIRMVNNNPTVIGDTVRKGYELEGKFYPGNSRDFSIFGSYAWVDARVIDPINPGQFLVPEVSEHVIKGGVSIQRNFGEGRNLLADLYYQYTSGAPYYRSSGTPAALATPIFGPDFDVYNFKLTYTGTGWSSFFSAKCRPREYSSDYTWVSNNLLV